MSAQRPELYAAGSVAFAAGVPAWGWQSGHFLNAIIDTGVGDITMTFNANDGIDPTEAGWISTPLGDVGASGLTNVCCVHTSDVAKQILIYQEGGGGAASAAADVDFYFAFLKLNAG